MNGPRALLFGDSHTDALQRALARRRVKKRPVPITVHRLLKFKNDVQLGDTTLDDFLVQIARLEPNDIVLSQVGGNQHAVFSTVQHPQPFDFYDALDPGMPVDEALDIIPNRMLGGFFAAGIEGRDAKSILAIRAATKARVVHLMAPPPKADNDHILRRHETRFAQDNIAAMVVSPPALRLKFWRLQCQILDTLCRSNGVETLYPPVEACVDGFLAPHCYANDATHANADYGELVLRQIEDCFAPCPSSEPAP